MSRVDLARAFAALDAYVAERIYADGSPGVAIALTDRERTLRVATYGSADIAAGTPVTSETLFEIGSIGKSFTADALLILAEQGLVDLDAPVARFLPWFSVRTRFGPISLRHLLTHTAGIVAGPDGSPSGEGEVWLLRETEASSPPGRRFHYSNVGYKVLGLVIAEVGGLPYPEVIRRLLLEPLGMEETEPAITNGSRRRLAVGHTGLYDDRPFHPRHPLVPATWLETDTGDGCLACPPADLAAYARLLLNRGRGPNDRILSEASFAAKVAPAVAVDDGLAYGLGVFVREDGGRTLVGHPGGMVGYVASVQVDPAAGFGAAVLMNGPGAPVMTARHALALLRSAAGGQELPAPPALAPDAEAVAGAYWRVEGAGPDQVQIESDPAAPARLRLRFDAERVPLVDAGGDALLADHPAFGRFALVCERDGSGRVAALAHGAAWYARLGTVAPVPAVSPAEWNAYPGHYRSHNPWCPSFHVVRRRGRLWLIFPAEPDGFEPEQPMVALREPGLFQVGEDPEGPERVRFDAPVGGRALRATLSGCPFWRVADA